MRWKTCGRIRRVLLLRLLVFSLWSNPEKGLFMYLLVHCAAKRVRALLRALMRFLGLSSLACVPYSTWLFLLSLFGLNSEQGTKNHHTYLLCRKLGLWITRTSSCSICTFNYVFMCLCVCKCRLI